ncbi:pseudoazurin [Paracoccus jiaweipingae]|uniref:pseudoazurin n=1 Tax=unclassified Paracoccus (in: a-proteobacteria) TaxID=2688777 RepID=UPI0037BC6DBD
MKPLLAALLIAAGPALAETHDIDMLNRGATGPMVFEPAYLRIAPGDTLRFLPTQPGHNAATLDGMIPAGATPFKSRINREFSVTLDLPGAYGIYCQPHLGMGMVMVVEVGDGPFDLPLPDSLPQRARDRFDAILSGRP